jgi:hypothetical protein
MKKRKERAHANVTISSIRKIDVDMVVAGSDTTTEFGKNQQANVATEVTVVKSGGRCVKDKTEESEGLNASCPQQDKGGTRRKFSLEERYRKYLKQSAE